MYKQAGVCTPTRLSPPDQAIERRAEWGGDVFDDGVEDGAGFVAVGSIVF